MLLKIYLVCFTWAVLLKTYPGNTAATFHTLPHQPFIKVSSITIDSVSCIIPFTRAGNLIVVKAQADTTAGNFILDTGAPNLVLNLTYFRNYPTTMITDGEQAGITGSSPFIIQTTVKSFSLGALNYHDQQADVTSLGGIENTKGLKILGLLGFELFKDCEMIIDYEKSVIYLHRITRKEAATYQNEMLDDVAAYTTMPIDITDNRIIVHSEMVGKNLKFIIDCAAENNILDSRLPDKIFNNVDVIRRVVLSGVGNKKVEAVYGNVKNIKIGEEKISNLPFLITNLEYTCFAQGGCIDGVLGFDYLSQHKTGFNFVKHKMYVWKQAADTK
ncbi:MAG: aspartyl protease family protein [Parafilimonas sp.]|nr:aspartyl protease family protein [Parafilimonas sp.]